MSLKQLYRFQGGKACKKEVWNEVILKAMGSIFVECPQDDWVCMTLAVQRISYQRFVFDFLTDLNPK